MIAPRRFWTEVTVEEDRGGFGLRLDDRPLRTPERLPLRVPSRPLAEAIAIEWRAVEAELRPEALPFTRAANVAIDRVAKNPAPVIDMIAGYGETDLLCYRAAHPLALRARQAAAWDPMLDWAATALGAPLRVADGIIPVAQPASSITALRVAISQEDPFSLTALHDLVTLSGSLVLGLAVRLGALEVDAAWSMSRIDEFWQSEQWGADEEAEAAAALRRKDFLRAAELLDLLAPA
jgi:chaperone required for assembly of F1-ATPase